VSARIFNIVRNAIQEVAIDGSPIVVDFGCVLGETFAAIHTLSSVICVLLQFSEKYRDHIRSYVRSYPALPRNMVHLYTPSRSFVTGELVEIYTLCNLFTIALVLEAVEDPTLETESVVAHAAKTVAVAHTTIVAFPLLPQQSQQQLLAQQDSELLCQMITDMIQRGLEKDSSVQFSCDVIARVQQSAQVLVVTRLVQISSSRGCRKTWGAPLVQWDRSQSVMFDHGAVTFRVNKVNKKKDGGGVEASSVMRVIHPLQYLHSFNLDHLLGAGLDLPQRLEFFGQMLQTPRYSDPLPHNWVLGGAGRLQRIDKVDLRYDRDVDESKGYWGHSTRGYLHLLGVHLCIPLGADGLPMALREMNRSCQQRCVACSCKCSYLPKGQVPCPSCMQCGECLREHAFSAQLLGSVDTSRLPRKCQKLYSSMDSARKEWRRWERADARYIQAQCDEV
jgi:hypothetical protein